MVAKTTAMGGPLPPAKPASRLRLPSRLTLREWMAGYFFAAPFIIGFLVFIAFPMIYSIWLSFNKWDMLSPPRFIGLANFTKMIADPPR